MKNESVVGMVVVVERRCNSYRWTVGISLGSWIARYRQICKCLSYMRKAYLKTFRTLFKYRLSHVVSKHLNGVTNSMIMEDRTRKKDMRK